MLNIKFDHLLNLKIFSMEITKEKLREIYTTHSNDKAAKILKISVPTLINCIKAAKIPLKGQGNRKKNKFKLKILGL